MMNAPPAHSKDVLELLSAALEDWHEATASGRTDAAQEASRRVASCVRAMRLMEGWHGGAWGEGSVTGAHNPCPASVEGVRRALHRCHRLIVALGSSDDAR